MAGTSLRIAGDGGTASAVEQMQVQVVTVELRALLDDQQLRRAHGVRLEVPVAMGRKGLSQVVAKLVEMDDKPLPLDFLVHDKLLRTTLAKFIARNNLSTEAVLPIQYILPVPTPSPRTAPLALPELPWVVSIDRFPRVAGHHILVGAADGTVSTLSQDAAEFVHHAARPHGRSLTALAAGDCAPLGCAAVARDNGDVEVWRLGEAGEQDVVATCHIKDGLKLGVPQALTWLGGDDEDARTLAVGFWNGGVAMYPMPRSLSNGIHDAQAAPASVTKKRKAADSSTPLALDNPLTLTGHSEAVAQLHQYPSSQDLLSGSWDATLRGWSTETGAMLRAYPSRTAITDFSLQGDEAAPSAVASLVDGSLQLVDLRAGSRVGAAGAVPSAHKGWAGAVAWKGNVIGSGGADDGVVKAWDVRSLRAPLMSVLEAHGKHGKVQALVWTESEGLVPALVSGGSDGSVRAYDSTPGME